ncbi:MAG: hypothetical protein EZS28_045083 [Streblomastix strix]|uniref:Uncharacterized protein n=1 Tax=Streblomastix strix TaxID=222440 RepID=A0A5J4TNH7_9EUKA|nr:MAG: hypothetical protein EZS28_045083 [Streblomastix strix]
MPNTPKATGLMQNTKNRYKNPTPRIRRRQSPILRLTSRNSWTNQGRKEERWRGKDLENRKTDNNNEEILDRNGGADSDILIIMGNNQHERFFPIKIYPLMEKQPGGTGKQAKEVKIMLEEELKENFEIQIRKEQIKWYNPTFIINKINWKRRNILDAKLQNKEMADFHFTMHDSNEVKKQLDLDFGHFTGPLLCISPPNSPNRIIIKTIIRIPEQPPTHIEHCHLEPNTHQYTSQQQWCQQCNKQE